MISIRTKLVDSSISSLSLRTLLLSLGSFGVGEGLYVVPGVAIAGLLFIFEKRTAFGLNAFS